MQISNFTTTTIDVNWFPIGTTTDENGKLSAFKEITLVYTPSNPVVEYSFSPFVHVTSKTPFFELKSKAETFVNGKSLENYFAYAGSDTIFTSIADRDFIIAKKNSSMTQEANCVYNLTGAKCTGSCYPSEYCTQNPNDLNTAFKQLVAQAKTYPDSPNSCAADLNINVADNYEYTSKCTIHTKRVGNQLLTDTSKGTSNGFSEGCAGSTDLYDKAMRCIMMHMINQLDAKMVSKSMPNFMGSQVEFLTFNLTYNGVMSSNIVYNTTI